MLADKNKNEGFGLEIDNMVSFELHLEKFQNQIKQGANFYLDFWQELLED